MRKKYSRSYYVVAIIWAAIALAPFLWSIYVSLKPTIGVFNTWTPLHKLTFNSYKYLLSSSQVQFVRWFVNSLVVAVAVTVGNLITNTLAGYAFARFKFPARGPLFMLILSVMMIPSQVLLVPMYMLLVHLGWEGSYQGLIIPFLMNPFMIFLTRQFFLGMPKELEDAARTDGLSSWGIFFRIFLPLAKPILATQTILTFQGNWNSLLWPALIEQTKQNIYTLPVGLNSLYGQYNAYWNQVLAGAILVTIPIMVIFFIFQRHFVQGFSTSGIK